MSIQSLSFYQQDQNYWSQAQAQSQASSADASLINVMGTAETNLARGLASIANQTALNRVNSEISSLVQQALQTSSGTSTSSSSSGSSESSSGSSSSAAVAANASGAPATATGTVPLTTSTSLSTLGILPGGTIIVGAGANVTKYTSTGTDTVADLLNTINVDLPTNANVTASLNSSGRLVITGRNNTDTITISGSGNDAAAIGFTAGNTSFEPKLPSTSPASSNATSSSIDSSSSKTSGSTASSKAATSSKSTALPSYLALGEQGVSTALGILSADGVAGSLVDLLA